MANTSVTSLVVPCMRELLSRLQASATNVESIAGLRTATSTTLTPIVTCLWALLALRRDTIRDACVAAGACEVVVEVLVTLSTDAGTMLVQSCFRAIDEVH